MEDDFYDDGYDDDSHESLGKYDRACGRRVKGGIYAEVRLSEHGTPLNEFFIDPPRIVTEQMRRDLGIKPLGVTLIQDPNTSIWHVLDWIGSKHYPNVEDFISEVRRRGLSRRLPKSLDFSRLGEGSRHLCIHSRAHIGNTFAVYRQYEDEWKDAFFPCLKHNPQHEVPLLDDPEMCVGFYRYDIEGGEPIGDGKVLRTVASLKYEGWPAIAESREYQPAMFWSLPLTGIAVINGEGADDAEEKARKAQIPVERWDE